VWYYGSGLTPGLAVGGTLVLRESRSRIHVRLSAHMSVGTVLYSFASAQSQTSSRRDNGAAGGSHRNKLEDLAIEEYAETPTAESSATASGGRSSAVEGEYSLTKRK
jgi:hypothetical protein